MEVAGWHRSECQKLVSHMKIAAFFANCEAFYWQLRPSIDKWSHLSKSWD